MNTLNRRDFLKGLGAISALSLLGRQVWAADGQRPPNIIFILADDYGLDGVGCYGSDQYQTPHLDALAKSGLRFETCYSTPLCGPTRCQLITGYRANDHWGFMDRNGKAAIAPQYDQVQSFTNGLAAVRQGGRWLYIDPMGKRVLDGPAEATWCGSLIEGLAPVKIGDKFGYMNRQGELQIPAIFKAGGYFRNGVAPCALDGKDVYINTTGKILWTEEAGAQAILRKR